MNAYDIARIIRESFDGGDRPYRYTPETGTFAFVCGGLWAVILQPFGQNIEFSCWCRPALSIMTAAKLAEYAERLNSSIPGGKFSVRGHETAQGKLQLSARFLKACTDDFDAVAFAGMVGDLEKILAAAGEHLEAVADGQISPEEAAAAALEKTGC
ncbi:MAG: hypothetical protein IJD13_04450 [Oscillospiraceae bacterium]|nr:hypothetical protein [Oscillospiraceae bacterium]